MTQLPKTYLLRQFERGLETSGWSILHLSSTSAHPARYRIARGGQSATLTVYIWNITHGGGPRSRSEYRIQITGLVPRQVLPDQDGLTLILGYWEQQQVFAGFDYNFHKAPLGGSPSLQVGRDALTGAKTAGFAVHRKSTGELVIGFRPDFAGTYVEHLQSLHEAGTEQVEAELLAQLSQDPDTVTKADIETTVKQPRQYAIIETRRALRDNDFRKRVLDAYSHQCALCDMQLELLDGAHIVPATEPNSTDETSNGLALCTLHHRAYDRALVTFEPTYSVVVHDLRLKELKHANKGQGEHHFRNELRDTVRLPPDPRDWPDPGYVREANELRGWAL